MKKLLFVSIGILCLHQARAQFPAPYCAERFPLGVAPISRVVFGSINNTSNAQINGSAGHENFTAISTNVQPGTTYTLTVSGNTDGNYTDHIRVFFDWNRNNSFSDAGESINVGSITNSNGNDGRTVSVNITLPSGVTAGAVRMRVSKRFSSFPAPCNNASFGQAEDYTIQVVIPVACSLQPLQAGTVAGPSSVCPQATFTLLVNGGTPVSTEGLSVQWQSSPDGITWSSISGATGPTCTISQQATTFYRRRMNCSAGQMAFSSALQVPMSPASGCLPDLLLTGLSLSSTRFEVNSDVTVSYSIANQGAVAAGAHQVFFYLSPDSVLTPNANGDVLLANTVAAGQASGSTSAPMAHTLRLNCSTIPGDYRLMVVADGSNQVAESEENNNGVSVPFTALVSGSCMTTSVSRIEADPGLQLSPNPSAGRFRLSLQLRRPQQLFLSVCNSAGLEVWKSGVAVREGAYDQWVDLSAAPAGVYFLQVGSDNGILRRRILISR